MDRGVAGGEIRIFYKALASCDLKFESFIHEFKVIKKI
jgi:hypothetical protein